MIDWWNFTANSLWIVACALALATLSYASWKASLTREKMRAQLGRPVFQFALNLAGTLFCAGMAATSGRIWEIGVWVALALVCITRIGMAVAKSRQPRSF